LSAPKEATSGRPDYFFTGAIPNKVRNSQTSRFVSVLGEGQDEETAYRSTVAIGGDGVAFPVINKALRSLACRRFFGAIVLYFIYAFI